MFSFFFREDGRLEMRDVARTWGSLRPERLGFLDVSFLLIYIYIYIYTYIRNCIVYSVFVFFFSEMLYSVYIIYIYMWLATSYI